MEGIYNVILGFPVTALHIRVFYAQDELASSLSCVTEAEQRHIGGANVGVSSGRWRYSSANIHAVVKDNRNPWMLHFKEYSSSSL